MILTSCSSLVQKDLASDFKSFMKTNSIQHLIVNMQGTKKVEIPAASMNLLMKIVLNPENHPVLIHCNHGKVIIVYVTAVLRIIADCLTASHWLCCRCGKTLRWMEN
jgi:tyrosine-protein phosphatase SIW14